MKVKTLLVNLTKEITGLLSGREGACSTTYVFESATALV